MTKRQFIKLIGAALLTLPVINLFAKPTLQLWKPMATGYSIDDCDEYKVLLFDENNEYVNKYRDVKFVFTKKKLKSILKNTNIEKIEFDSRLGYVGVIYPLSNNLYARIYLKKSKFKQLPKNLLFVPVFDNNKLCKIVAINLITEKLYYK